MLFNSWEFLLLFLPATFALFFALARRSQWMAAAWLAMASVFFYGWWSPAYVPLLLFSITTNFLVGRRIGGSRGANRRHWLQLGLIFNLALLGYFKYANFFVDNIGVLFGSTLPLGEVILPLGISFFTFTQIAFLVDTYQADVKEYRFVHYLLFVTYFPHLIAGPILHHAEMMPQFSQSKTYRVRWDNLSVGTAMFVIGMAKKLLLADSVAKFVPATFVVGGEPGFVLAWTGALAYTAQLYFDFSGYSDMAIGLSRLFGIRLPLNFNSPYKAMNIADFWRRWHMTLSRFLRDYLYVPLGGNRGGSARRYRNLLVTMLLGGLWHGAGWTFVIWGGLHGIFLVVHRAWSAISFGAFGDRVPSAVGRLASWAITFVAVVIAWVFFRAPDVGTALSVLEGMSGLRGVVLPGEWFQGFPAVVQFAARLGVGFEGAPRPDTWEALGWIAGSLAITVALPNSQQLLARFAPALEHVDPPGGRVRLAWQPTFGWASALAVLFSLCLLRLGSVSEFLYFQF